MSSPLAHGRVIAFGFATIGALTVAAVGFRASWHGLTLLGEAHGLAGLAAVLPLSLDGLVLASTMGVINAHLAGQSARAPWVITLAATALSATLNGIAAVPTAHWAWLTPLLWALLPTLMAIAFHQAVTQAAGLFREIWDHAPAQATPAVTHEVRTMTHRVSVTQEATHAVEMAHGSSGSPMGQPVAQPVGHAMVEAGPAPVATLPDRPTGLPTKRPFALVPPADPEPEPALEPVSQADPEPSGDSVAGAASTGVSATPVVDKAAIVREICDAWLAATPLS